MNEQEVSLVEVPEVVVNAALAAVPGIALDDEAEFETEDNGAIVFELEGTADGQEFELEVSAAGEVLEIEIDDEEEEESSIALSEVPDIVVNAALAAVPGIALDDEAEFETEDNGAIVFELEGTANGQEFELEIGAAGEVFEIEIDDEEEEESSIALSEVPDIVVNAALAAVPGIALDDEAEFETEDNGAIVFELEGTADGQEFELEVSAAGEVLEIEIDDGDDLDDIDAIDSLTGIRLEDLVDEDFYAAQNPDVAAAIASGTVEDALTHFLSLGQFEGRDPGPFFDTDFYLSANPDVAAAGISAAAHFTSLGAFEGRDPSAGFDTDAYLAANPDVAAAIATGGTGLQTAFQHFLTNGFAEGRSGLGL